MHGYGPALGAAEPPRSAIVNWLDIVLLAIIVVACLGGIRLGLFQAAFVVVGVIVGWLVAGQLSDDVGAALGGSTSSETLVTTVSYTLIVAACAMVAAYAVKIARPTLAVLTMGLSKVVDRLGGLAVGLLLGIAVTAAIVIAGARLTYDFDTGALADRAGAADRLPEVEGVRDGLESALAESTLVGIVVDVAGALPAGALGLAPSDFEVALDLLRDQIG